MLYWFGVLFGGWISLSGWGLLFDGDLVVGW